MKRAKPGIDDRDITYKSPKKFTKTVVRLEERDNRGLNHLPAEQRKQGIYMINSSYLLAADPNSMRSFGPLRNAIYNIGNDHQKPTPVSS